MNGIWLLLAFFFSFCVYYFVKNKLAVFFPSSRRMIKVIMEFADLKEKDVLYDLGSGDGRILEEAAKKGIRVVGIEQNPILNWLAGRRTRDFKNVRIIHGNIFDQKIDEATVVVAYLSQPIIKKLQRKIEKEVKDGTKIILLSHKFSGWKPIKIRKVGLTHIRLYVKQTGNNFIL